MTREEAIEVIQQKFRGWFNTDSRIYKALEMAIQALEQNESAEEWYKLFVEKLDEQEPCKTCGYAEGSPFCLKYCPHDAERKKEQEPCDDAISREDVIKLVEFSGYDLQFGIDNDDMCDDVMKLPSVTPKPIECEDAVSRKPNCIDCIHKSVCFRLDMRVDSDYAEKCGDFLTELPSVTQKSGKCKNCKYFEYDSVAKVDGIPLIVAHEICNKWGNGCKTSEDGYCYLFEPQESEDKE